jgi:cytochrome P450
MGRLVEELDRQLPPKPEHAITYCVSFSQAQKLPYLDACIKEAFRMHPAAQWHHLRVVPPQGATICGHFVPGGTEVGCNAWVLHRNKATFGSDVDLYRPERWLVDDKAKVRQMDNAMFQFGAGHHTCIGKNISLLEIYKLVPSLLKTFTVGTTFLPGPVLWRLLMLSLLD